MNEIQIFNNNYFGQLRVFVKDGKVWFCLADACKALEIKNPRQVKARLDSRGVISNDTPTTCKNRHGEFTMMNPMTFIDEANLYRCIFQSKKEGRSSSKTGCLTRFSLRFERRVDIYLLLKRMMRRLFFAELFRF